MEKVRWLDEDCITCGSRLNSWDAKLSKALQYQNDKCEISERRQERKDYIHIKR